MVMVMLAGRGMRRTRSQDKWECCHVKHAAGFPRYIIQLYIYFLPSNIIEENNSVKTRTSYLKVQL